VDYFDRPNVAREEIERDLVHYNQKWPHRRFWLEGDIQLQEQSGGEVKLAFPLRYELRNGSRHPRARCLKASGCVRRQRVEGPLTDIVNEKSRKLLSLWDASWVNHDSGSCTVDGAGFAQLAAHQVVQSAKQT